MAQYFLVGDFKGGLDVRRMPLTSPSGSLVKLKNGHISRGGEIEKREAFPVIADLPSNSFGLLATANEFLVFGSNDIPNTRVNSNPAVIYSRLTVVGGANMVRILSAELFDGKPYVIAEFDDASIHHFFDGTEVGDWFDAKGRARFSIIGGSATPATPATGSFVLSGGFNGDSVDSVTVGATELLSSSVQFAPGFTLLVMLSAVRDAINANTQNSGYSAVWSGQRITITSSLPGSGPNGSPVNVVTTGLLEVSNIQAMAGGVDASSIDDVTINGVSVLDGPVSWSGSNGQTARAVAASIDTLKATTGYGAEADGQAINIRAEVDGVATNGHPVVVSFSGGIEVSPPGPIQIQGGSASPSTLRPGTYAKTHKSKVYVLAGSLLRYSGLNTPNQFEGVTGAGFENLAASASGSENLIAMANYFTNVAVFSKKNVQIWFIDTDPAGNSHVQTINNTNIIGAVVEFGDNDVFFLSESGIRSLRARDSSNAAFVSDIGTPIDGLIQDEILADEVAASKAAAVLEPREGRYIIAIGSRHYVFSFFSDSKVSAWSTYEPGFVVEDWAFSGQLVVCRSRDKLYRYGGEAGRLFDTSEVVAELPFLDADNPATEKTWLYIDVACEGTWRIEFNLNPRDPDDFQELATVVDSTYGDGHIPIDARSTHIALRFTNVSNGPAKIGNVAVHYASGDSR